MLPRARWYNYLLMNAYYIGLGFMWNSLHRATLQNVVPPMVGLDNKGTALSILLTAGLIFAIVVQPAAGALSDRWTARLGRRRPFMIGGTVLDLLFLAGLAWVFAQPLTYAGIAMPAWFPLTTNADYWFLFLAYCGLQFSSNIAHGAAQGLIPDLLPEAQRGAASGVKAFIDIFMIIIVGIVTGTLLLGNEAWVPIFRNQMVIAAIAIFLLVFLAVNVVGIRERPITRAEVPTTSVGAALKRTFAISRQRDPDYIWLIVSRLFILGGMGIVTNFVLYYFQYVLFKGQPNADVEANQLLGSMLIIVGGMICIVSIPAGILSDRWGRKPFTALGGILAAVGAVAFIFVRNRVVLAVGPLALTDLLLAGMFLGIGVGLFNSVNWAWATDLVPDKEAARYLGISNLATGGSQILGFLGGVVLDIFSRAQLGDLGYTVTFVLGALWLLVGVVVLPKVRETRGRSGGLQTGSKGL
jgi:MFS family permease